MVLISERRWAPDRNLRGENFKHKNRTAENRTQKRAFFRLWHWVILAKKINEINRNGGEDDVLSWQTCRLGGGVAKFAFRADI
jgi:hypothetical protein